MKTAFVGDKATLLLFYACSLAPRGSAFVGIWNPQSMPGGIRNIQRKSPLDQRMGNRYTFSSLNQKMSTDDDATIEGDAVPVRSELNTDVVAPSLKSSPLKFLKSKFTRKNLSAVGMSLLLSYGFVSNVNSAAIHSFRLTLLSSHEAVPLQEGPKNPSCPLEGVSSLSYARICSHLRFSVHIATVVL